MKEVVIGCKSRRFSIVFALLSIFVCALTSSPCILAIEKNDADMSAAGSKFFISKEKKEEIEKYIRDQVHKGKLPGAATIVVKEDQTVFEYSIGFSNIKRRERINSKTLFEIGANSKAFTGLGILWLQHNGKLKLDDRVQNHLPWFEVSYKKIDKEEKSQEKLALKVEHLLYHTSGIPFETYARIPESDRSNALEETVRTLVGVELNHAPGTEFAYATVNYDILGLIIQKVSGQPFEVFMKEKILDPLGLKKTFLSRSDIPPQLKMATGYKISLFVAAEYKSPIYKGNTPAGYFISNTDDLSRWMKIQLVPEAMKLPDNFPIMIIGESQKPFKDEKVPGFRYASGWFVFKGKEIFHSGNNPNYSSMIILSKPKNLGIAVLANLNTGRVENIGWGILGILNKQSDKESNYLPMPTTDFYMEMDKYSFGTILFFCFLLVYIVWRKIKIIHTIVVEKRKFDISNFQLKSKILFVLATIFLLAYIYAITIFPSFLSYDFPWKVASVWAPTTFSVAAVIALIAGISCYLYILLAIIFPTSGSEKKER